MACSPIDVYPMLEFEKEEDTIFEITKDLPVEIDVEDTGSLEGLGEWLATNKYDVVHITGHADIDDRGKPFFWMEDEEGLPVPVTPSQLWEKLSLNLPGLVFLSGCRTGEAPEHVAAMSFAHGLVAGHVSTVLGWGLSVSDKGASCADETLYFELSRGEDIPDTLLRTRYELLKYYPTDWSLLRLFSDGTPLDVPLVQRGQKKRPKLRELQYAFLENSQVKVLEKGFIGRRRQIQRGLRCLRKDNKKVGLLLHGTGGLGKSCLAGKFCERFKNHVLIIVHGELNAVTFHEALKDGFIRGKDDEGLNILEEREEMPDKIRRLCSSFFQNRAYLVLLDDFEKNMPGAEEGVLEVSPEAVPILETLLRFLPYSGKMTQLIITSRYTFSLTFGGIDLVGERLELIGLTSFRDADERKKVLGLKNIQECADEVKRELIELGRGNPLLLDNLNTLVGEVKDVDINSLLSEAKGKQEEFVQELVLRQILEAQPEAFQTFLRRSAVYRQPVLKEGIRLVCDDLKDWDLQAEKAVRLSLMEEDSTRIDYVQYWVTPLLRGDIFAELGEEERRRCHKTAVSYYQGILSKSRSHAPISGEELIEHALKAGLDEVTIEEGGRLLHYLHNTPAYEKALAQGRYILSHVSKPKIDESTEHCKNRLALLGTTEISRDTLNLKKSDFLYELGSVEKALGKWEDAKLHLEECIELVEKVKDPDRIARSCNQLGDVLYRTGTLEDAFKYFDRALEISKTQKRWGRVTSILDRFRTYYRLQKESDKIIEKFDECLKLCSESNDLRSMANMMTGMARAYIDIGNYEMALAKLDGSIKIWDKLKEDRYLNYKAEILERNRAETLERRGDALKAMGRWDESLRLYEVVYQIKKQLGDVLGETGLLNVIAATLQQAERYTLAVEKHEESLKIVRETRAVVLLTMILTIGGSIYRELENWHKALQRYEECYQVGKEIGYLSAEGGGLMGMGEVYMRQGNLKGALIKFQDSLEIWKDLKRESEIGVISQKLGKLHLKLGEYDRAYEFAIQANEILETSSFTIGGIIHLGKAKLSLAEVCLAQKKYKKAFAIIKQARDIFDKLRLSHLQREAGQLERNVNPKTQPCLSCIFNDRKHPEKQFS